MKYLGVPITTSRLSKLECRALVEKIVGKIRPQRAYPLLVGHNC